ncbi:disease resistance protein (TIR-NBS-LRR class), putative [Medicago truncatula]|uniref:Disease resistance protein (TIR-NBS-LRR class), putative n=1 Tax=Medicago truncatula TaxID=3880 RepID=A0A072VF16_MEDTR|nr:disease resistance protein (TIR-NBS-LRR class), putative [Medicago truncatula]
MTVVDLLGRDGYEHEFIGKIVEQVSREIKPLTIPVVEYRVGLEPQRKNVLSLLNVGCDDRVAKENSEKHGLIYLQKIILLEIIGEKEIELTSVKQGISVIQQRLRKKKVLLLLDDVDEQKQLDAIAGGNDWYGLGSRVIITTRDKGLLLSHGVESTYEVHELNKKDAFELLRQKAFKTNKVCPNYADVLNRALTHASGLPLALEVIGSHLFHKTVEQCKSTLDRYERIPDKKMQTLLKVSFDALEEEEKSVFLDIACCFKGYDLTIVNKMLHAHHGDNMEDHMQVLVEKSLIKITESRSVTLHDVIEDMGKEIVRQESPKEPGKRSRLWCPEDIVQVLEENTGTSKIEIIYLDSSIEVKWDEEAFKKMENLRTLIIRHGAFSESPKYLPNSLRILEWRKYPSGGVPSDFYPKKLAICKIAFDFTSFVWGDFLKKKFQNMKVLNIDNCGFLARMPDISGLLNLEELSFQYCENLITMDDSVGLLAKLKILRVGSCKKLKSLPPLKLVSLEELDLSYIDSLESFPHVVDGFLNKLQTLSVKNCNTIRSIPPLKMASLEELNLLYCDSLECFPLVVDGLLEKLKILRVIGCSNIKSIPPFKLTSLEELDLSYCNSLTSFPVIVDGFLDKLKLLSVRYCCKLKNIPPLKLGALEQLDLSYCNSLESFPPVVDGLLGKLKILKVFCCNSIISIPPLKLDSLKELHLSYCDSLENFQPVMNGLLKKLQFLSIKSCINIKSIPPLQLTSLEELDLSNCQSLESFPPVVDQLLENLKFLSIRYCHKLRIIPPLKLDSLELLDISYCDSLDSFPHVVDGMLEKLKIMRVKSCSNLKSIPPLKLASLEELDLSYCDSLESFPTVVDGFLGKLRVLSVKGCNKLKSFPPLKLASLEVLDLSYCDNLESFPLLVDGFMDKLQFLSIIYCSKLRSIPPLKLALLEHFDLSYCDSLVSFPPVVDGMLEKLRIFRVISCNRIQSIPPLKLTSLEELNLTYCDGLESFPHVVDGLLGKLKVLNVRYCHKLKSIPPLKLDSLEQLDLSYCDSLKSFPPIVDGQLKKLKILRVTNCSNIRSIPPLNLASLEELNLSYCHNLECFPLVVDRFPNNLKVLSVRYCRKLKSIPPLKFASLEVLDLSYCDNLESFPKILGEMENIRQVHLYTTPIKELPFSFQNLTRLRTLYLCNCGIVQLPSSIVMMQELDELIIEDGGWLFQKEDQGDKEVISMQSSQVEFLRVWNCNLSDESLAIGLMWFANKLFLDNCENLQEIKGIPPNLKTFSAINCISLTLSCTSKFMNQELHESGNTSFVFPQAEIPKWIDHQCMQGLSISFWFRNKFPAIVLCVVSPLTRDNYQPNVKVFINGKTFFYRDVEADYEWPISFHLHIFHMQIEKFNDDVDAALLENEWNHVVVDFGFEFHKSGIHVLKEKSSMMDIQFTNPENDVNMGVTL